MKVTSAQVFLWDGNAKYFFLLLYSAVVSFAKPQDMGVLVAEALNKVSLEEKVRVSS